MFGLEVFHGPVICLRSGVTREAAFESCLFVYFRILFLRIFLSIAIIRLRYWSMSFGHGFISDEIFTFWTYLFLIFEDIFHKRSENFHRVAVFFQFFCYFV